MFLPFLQHSSPLFADLNTTGGTENALDVTVDGELTGSEGANHEETSSDTGVGATETELLTDLHETTDGALTGETLGLVDLGEHGVGGLRDDSGGETSNETGTKVDTSLSTVGQVLLVNLLVDGLGDLLENDELGHGVGDLLEQDGSESRVEGSDALLLEDTAETAEETASEGRLGNETDTGGLEGAESNVGHELGAGRGGEVDSSAVVSSGLVAELVDGLLLEELVTSELEGTLEEVTGSGRTETSQESASTLLLDDLLETADHATVVGSGIELDTGLDNIERSDSSVSDGAATGAGKGEPTI